MTDPKTTWTSFITSGIALGALFGFDVDPKYVLGLVTIGGAIVGYLAADKK